MIEFVKLEDVPAIAQAAVAHAQFETIHPFIDGNGRAGRCLIHVIFRRRGLTPLVAPPVSVVLATDARGYIAGLIDYREQRVDDWIGTFADAVTSSAEAARRLWRQIDDLFQVFIKRAGSPRADSVARKIILSLTAQPLVSAETVATTHRVSQVAARGALNRLESTGVLVPARLGRRRGREWISNELFQLLDAFEHDLARPAESGRPTLSPTSPPRRRQ